jgi:hypothetical protein
MPVKYPIEYEIAPNSVETGTHWVTVQLKNVGDETLTALDIRLNSLDSLSIDVQGSGSYVAALAPGEEETLPFQVAATLTTSLYLSMNGFQGTDSFYWESPYIPITVGREAAELMSFFAMTEPYPVLNTRIRCEARVQGKAGRGDLRLEFWADTPRGEFSKFGEIELSDLDPGEVKRHHARTAVTEEGMHTLYAYLFDGIRRIGREVAYVYATPST